MAFVVEIWFSPHSALEKLVCTVEGLELPARGGGFGFDGGGWFDDCEEGVAAHGAGVVALIGGEPSSYADCVDDVLAGKAYGTLTYAGSQGFDFDVFEADTAFFAVVGWIFLLDFEQGVEECFCHVCACLSPDGIADVELDAVLYLGKSR